tara:strand:+ start:310 stop:603 length:294 start_codon:yes stop_codon:yes gene_type:complete
MNKLQNALKLFSDLSVDLYQAISKNDYETVCDITTEQRKLIQALAISDIIVNAELRTNWEQALEQFKSQRRKLQIDLKKLNNNTQKNLKRLKGYSQK